MRMIGVTCKLGRAREAEWFVSRSRIPTMTPLTQAYHCRCLLVGIAAKVFEYAS